MSCQKTTTLFIFNNTFLIFSKFEFKIFCVVFLWLHNQIRSGRMFANCFVFSNLFLMDFEIFKTTLKTYFFYFYFFPIFLNDFLSFSFFIFFYLFFIKNFEIFAAVSDKEILNQYSDILLGIIANRRGAFNCCFCW